MVEAEAAKRIFGIAQIAKSLICTALGTAPGGFWFANAGTTQSAVILGLGALIGFGLSLPSVSVGNVLFGTVGAIALTNAPRSMRGEIADTFFRDADDLPKNDSGRRD